MVQVHYGEGIANHTGPESCVTNREVCHEALTGERAIALRAATDGANVVTAAKTADPHAKLPGTIHTVAKEINDAGGQARPLVVDVRNAEHIQEAMAKAAERFGGIDILVNNASARCSWPKHPVRR